MEKSHSPGILQSKHRVLHSFLFLLGICAGVRVCLPVDNPPSTDQGPLHTPCCQALSFPPHGRQTCHSHSACPSVSLSVSLSVRCASWADQDQGTPLVGCPCQCPVQFFSPDSAPTKTKTLRSCRPRRLLCVRNFDINSLGQFYKRLSGLTCSSGIHIFHWPTCHYCVCQNDPSRMWK